jgi:hypothetical protein
VDGRARTYDEWFKAGCRKLVILFEKKSFKKMSNFSDSHDNIDTPNEGAFITIERLEAFQLTNPYSTSGCVALYAQTEQKTMFSFNRISAKIQLSVYVIMLLLYFLLILLFVLIHYWRPTVDEETETNWPHDPSTDRIS